MSLSLERRAKPLEDLQDVCCDGRSPYRGIVRTVNEFGLFVDFGCSVVGMLDEDYDDPALIEKQSCLQAGDVVTVYPICKDLGNGRVYLSLKKRDVPIRSVWDLAADGQTPYLARVVSVHGRDCTMDLGADTRGLLTPNKCPAGNLHEAGGRRHGPCVHTSPQLRDGFLDALLSTVASSQGAFEQDFGRPPA